MDSTPSIPSGTKVRVKSNELLIQGKVFWIFGTIIGQQQIVEHTLYDIQLDYEKIPTCKLFDDEFYYETFKGSANWRTRKKGSQEFLDLRSV
jgi:hypothetical protein